MDRHISQPQTPDGQPWYATYFGPHYLALYSQRLLETQETGWEAEFVGRALELKSGARILDVPCGFGRHLRRLSSAGYQPYGLDLQAPYLQYSRMISARNRDEAPAPVTVGDMARLPFAGGAFDAVANLFNSFGYFPDDSGPENQISTNRDCLAEFARVLKPGGRLLIDVPDRDDLVKTVTEQPKGRFGGEDWEIIEEWRYDPQSNLIHNQSQFRIKDTSHDCGYVIRLYTREELEDEIRAAGLQPWKFWNDLHRDAEDRPGHRLVIAARKP